jgi:glycosyltransferase involved in cell wall biosynthesis
MNPCYWPEVRRGSERFARELADGLIERGHRPRLITSHPGPPSVTDEDGLRVVRFWRPPDGRLDRRMMDQYMTHVPFSYLALRAGSDDVAHALYPTDALAAVRWSRRTGRPSILSFMGVPDRRGLVMRRRRTRHTLDAARGVDAVVALSDTARDAFWRWLGVEARVINPGVNLRAFALGERRAERPTVFCGAQLGEPRKRVDMLIRAMRRVRKERPEARLVLSRPRDPAALASLDGAAGEVELADVDDRTALAGAYGEAWVSALPSFGEAFGLVLVEALACGTPVVASNLDGMREIVDRDSVGRLFDGGEEELARALLEALELAEDAGTRRECRARAEAFSTDRCTEEYLALYSELIGAA